MEMKDVTFSTPDMPPSLFDQSGHLMNPGVAKEHYDVMWGIIAGAFKYSKEHCASIPSTESLMDHFRTKVQEMQMDQVSSNLVLAMARSWGDFVGEPIEKQSLKFFWLEECIEGGKAATTGNESVASGADAQ